MLNPHANVIVAQASAMPDSLDWTISLTYFSTAFGLAALGYVCMMLDIRAYLRSLRRALVLISNYRVELPEWVRRDTPRCVLALGLTMPCTQEDILAAYRRKVKSLHPDLGGDQREFMRLQAHFEQAMALVAER
jgi:hypothetical protein